MIAFKACPRCRGDMCHDGEDELSCLQCGNRVSVRPVAGGGLVDLSKQRAQTGRSSGPVRLPPISSAIIGVRPG
jgi:hypothetical protein